MTTGFKFRLSSFALAIVLMAVMIGWAAHTTWRQVEQLSERLTRVQIESFRTADQFRANLQELDYRLLRYKIHGETNDWVQFLQESKKLDHWIDEQRPTLTTQQEGQILDQINEAYDHYLAAGTNLLANGESRQAALDSPLAGFENVERESKRLLDLGYQLVQAHSESLSRFLAETRRSLVLLRALIFSALSLLLILGSGLAVAVYRDMITPLRIKLVESHAIIERQEKLASLGVLAAGVAHEIRNPLTAIKARLFTLQKALKSGSAAHEDSTVIGAEINRLERIVRDVLQFARPADPNLSRLSAEAPLREVHDLLAPELARNHIELKLEGMAQASILADPAQLKQALINLVQNAADSIDRAGVIVLRSRSEMERLHGVSQPVVLLEVVDNGKGIHPDVQKRLFDPFFTTKDGGTGLGLAIAARIVEKHGGALEFQTQVNHGTTFGIVLPQAI